ncbi:MAG: Hsp70 family protein [Egibacteraceae bacterium]
MGYRLGIDLGTTYTAAAVYHQGRPEVVALGSRISEMPSVVYLGPDGSILVGDAAHRRGVTDPDRVATQFKRRIGEDVPLTIGGVSHSAEALTTELLRWVFDAVRERQGGPPEGAAIACPAHWDSQKRRLLSQAAQLAGLDGPLMLTGPEAAAIFSASTQRIEPGEIVAVYDLGGGTFDTAVLRRASSGVFEALGPPQGIERLGGMDFDDAILAHVNQALDGALGRLDLSDPVTAAAVARLRQECVEAKEALSTDVDVRIPVLLPQVVTQVRLVRNEFESLIRPAIGETIEAVKRALHGAGVTPDEVRTVLLIGGSARIPLVAQMLSTEFGRVATVHARPTHAIALGAAIAAAHGSGRAPASQLERERLRGGAFGSAVATVPPVPEPSAAPSQPPPLQLLRQTGLRDAPAPARSLPFPPNAGSAFLPPLTGQHRPRRSRRRGRVRRLGRIGVLAGVLASAVFLLLRWLEPPAPLTARINGITVAGDRYVVDWESSGFTSALDSEHVHFYFDAVPADQAGAPGQGPWWELGPSRPFTGWRPADRPAGATQLCVLVANPDHTVRPGSGGCAPLP